MYRPGVYEINNITRYYDKRLVDISCFNYNICSFIKSYNEVIYVLHGGIKSYIYIHKYK